jgi:hypothetical protein
LSLLSPADAAELASFTTLFCTPSSLRICWDRQVGRRAGILRLFRVFTACSASGSGLDVAVDRSRFIQALELEAGAASFCHVSVAAPIYWPLRDGYALDSNGPQLLTRRPVSVWEVLQTDNRSSLTVEDVLALFASDSAIGGESAEREGDGDVESDLDAVLASNAAPSMLTPLQQLQQSSTHDGNRAAKTSASAAMTVGTVGRTTTATSSEMTLRFSLLQSVSDGPHGREWQEIFLGMRTLRNIDGLLPGTAYSFCIQAINKDGIASLLGNPSTMSTALPSPASFRISHVTSTSVALQWVAVSGSSALGAQRAAGGQLAQSPTKQRPAGEAEATETARRAVLAAETANLDVNSVLNILVVKSRDSKLAKAKGSGQKKKVGPSMQAQPLIPGFTPKGGPAGQQTPATAVASLSTIREGDGGVGIDLKRAWVRYDPTFTEVITTASLRGLLADLGVYLESPEPALGLLLGPQSSETVPTTAAQIEARFEIARTMLDPKDSGKIRFDAFSNWWNGADQPHRSRRRKLRRSSGSQTRRSASVRSISRGSRTTAGSTDVENDRGVVDLNNTLNSERGDLSATNQSTGSFLDLMNTANSGARPICAPTMYLVELRQQSDALRITSDTHPSKTHNEAFSPWIHAYFGADCNTKLIGLLPNKEYQLRITAVGRHAMSPPSKPVCICTPPLAPFAPVVIATTSRSVSLRWYAGELGAAKYEVQIKAIETIRPNTTASAGLVVTPGIRARTAAGGTQPPVVAGMQQGSFPGYSIGRNLEEPRPTSAAMNRTGTQTFGETRISATAPRWQEDIDSHEGWGIAYCGSGTSAIVPSLQPATVYRLRVRAINDAGAASKPSSETQIITPRSLSDTPQNAPGVAASLFSVECPLLALEVGGLATAGDAHDGATVGSNRVHVLDVVVGDVLVWTEDVFIDAASPRDVFGPTTIRELPSTAPTAAFACSRTVSAMILSDSASSSLNAAVDPDSRLLTVQVEWCVLGEVPKGVAPHVVAALKLPKGHIGKRAASLLASQGVLRRPWEDEGGRWTSAEEAVSIVSASARLVSSLASPSEVVNTAE